MNGVGQGVAADGSLLRIQQFLHYKGPPPHSDDYDMVLHIIRTSIPPQHQKTIEDIKKSLRIKHPSLDLVGALTYSRDYKRAHDADVKMLVEDFLVEAGFASPRPSEPPLLPPPAPAVAGAELANPIEPWIQKIIQEFQEGRVELSHAGLEACEKEHVYDARRASFQIELLTCFGYRFFRDYIRPFLPKAFPIVWKNIRQPHVVQNIMALMQQPQAHRQALPSFLSLPGNTGNILIAQVLQFVVNPEIFTTLIQHEATVKPIEMMIELYIKQLDDESASASLFASIRDFLLDLLNTDPRNLDASNKRMILTFLESVLALSRSWNACKKACKQENVPENNLEEAILAKMVKQLFDNKILAVEASVPQEERLQEGLRKQIERLIWFKRFPEQANNPNEQTLIQKTIVLLSATGFQSLVSTVFTPEMLNLVLLRILEEPLNLYNPFDREMPGYQSFNGCDEAFNKYFDTLVQEIGKQVVDLHVENIILKSVGQRFISWLPDFGKRFQQEINRLLNTGGPPLLPLLIALQLGYHTNQNNPPENVGTVSDKEKHRRRDQFLREQYLHMLKHPKIAIDIQELLNDTQEYKQALRKKVDAEFLNDPKRLTTLLEKNFPKGTSSFVLGLIQEFYKMQRHETFLRVFQAYVVDGLIRS